MLILTTETVFVWFSLGFEAHGFDPLDVSLKLSNATFRLLILFMGFVWLAEQTLVLFFLKIINRLAFAVEVQCVVWEVRTDFVTLFIVVGLSMVSGSLSPRHGASSGCGCGG